MFPICELPFAPDNVELIYADDDYRYFVVNNITDVAAVKGDVHMVKLPHTMSGVLNSVTPIRTRIVKGDKVYFDIEVSNSGNMPITGFKLTAILFSKEVAIPLYNGEVFDDLSKIIDQNTNDNFKAVLDEETGKPKVDENGREIFECQDDVVAAAGVLWPGATKTFEIPFSIDVDLDEFDIKVNIDEFFCDDKLKFKNEIRSEKNNKLCFACDNRTVTAHVDNKPQVSNVEVGVSDADYQITDTNGNVIDETSPSVVNDNLENSPINHASSDAPTGDSTLPVGLGVAGVAAGAVAAGAAIYNKRRRENEDK